MYAISDMIAVAVIGFNLGLLTFVVVQVYRDGQESRQIPQWVRDEFGEDGWE